MYYLPFISRYRVTCVLLSMMCDVLVHYIAHFEGCNEFSDVLWEMTRTISESSSSATLNLARGKILSGRTILIFPVVCCSAKPNGEC